ncbi:hypothetical protein [Fibrobacter succinogenes]|uniref:hypothetical protein n=1 Tax=Fibrobacter succinogenes TaxID=833 RepID=UPI0015683D41|nr:hypothetical protein [Fibrobacter succinogenes]
MKEKIPFYNIVNMFFVGCVFVIFTIPFFIDAIDLDATKKYSEIISNWTGIISVVAIAAMFEIGFIINRLGSIIIEPLYVILKIWPREKYDAKISEISQSNAKFQSMITELNLMRSHIMICLIILIAALFLGKFLYALSMFALICVFSFGGRKHNTKINIIRKQNG